MASQIAISDLRSIADTAGFIAVYPQSTPIRTTEVPPTGCIRIPRKWMTFSLSMH